MYKKAILASAIAGLVSGPALSASWISDEVKVVTHITEGISAKATAGTGVAATDGMLSLGVEYAANDLLTVTSSVAKATNASWPTSMSSATVTKTTNLTGCLINAGNTDAGDTVLTLDGCTGLFTAGDYISIGSTANRYRLASVASATAITLAAPGLTVAIADNNAVTQINKKKTTFTLVSNNTTSATYRVSAVAAELTNGSASGATSTIGGLVRFQTPDLDAAALTTAGTATLSTSSTTGAGTAMDTNAGTQEVAKTAAGFTYAVGTAFDATVSVDLARLKFTDNGVADALVYTTTQTAASNGRDAAGASVATVSPVLNTTSLAITASDWTYLDTNATTAGIQLNTTNKIVSSTQGTNPATGTFNTAGTVYTLTDTAVRAAETITVTKGVTTSTLPEQTYSSVMTIAATPNGGTKTDYTYSAAAGTWGVNAASITAYGVPFGSSVSRFLWINNTGTTDGAMSATFMQGGVSTALGTIGTASGRSSTEIGSLIDAALVTAGITPTTNSRANIAVSVSSPAADIAMTAAYKVNADNDRLNIETSDSLD
jgi:hypothetical protein